jgi:UDP-glucose 6-dehydrogenase
LLAQELSAADLAVVVYDPSADSARALGQSKNVRCVSSAQECIAQSGMVVLATPWQEFRELSADQWTRNNESRVVIDCWRVLNHLEGVEGIRYVRLGFGGEIMRPLEATSAAD